MTSPPVGITPPTPGLEREEPEQVLVEEDIPSDDNGAPEPSTREIERE
jgi:hypothetical protein